MLKVDGLKPDATKAALWYKLAVKGGNLAAKTALAGLQ
jgi:TPR repeat protein